MKRYIGIAIFIFFVSCESGYVFEKKNPHEAYGKKLTAAGLAKTALGKLWFDAAEKSISNPVSITLPYKQTGYFPSEKPIAIGMRFHVKRGAKLTIALKQKPASSVILFTDLWKLKNAKPEFLQAADTTIKSIEYEVDETADYILRLQPELLADVEYQLSIDVGSSLQYPVAGTRAKVGSFWGDERDAGARRHEGIDIFDVKGTPVVAAADGRVTRLGNGGIGGKTVWMRAVGKGLSLYYAHLDQQFVSAGQPVKAGDTLGLMGNTGNARFTPPHLHFGIYTNGGAVDPLPFVNRIQKAAPATNILWPDLNKYYRNTIKLDLNDHPLSPHTLFYVMAGDYQQLLGELPNGQIVAVSRKHLRKADNQPDIGYTADTAALLSSPSTITAKKAIVYPNTRVTINGYYNGFAFISITETGQQGWLSRNLLNH